MNRVVVRRVGADAGGAAPATALTMGMEDGAAVGMARAAAGRLFNHANQLPAAPEN